MNMKDAVAQLKTWAVAEGHAIEGEVHAFLERLNRNFGVHKRLGQMPLEVIGHALGFGRISLDDQSFDNVAVTHYRASH